MGYDVSNAKLKIILVAVYLCSSKILSNLVGRFVLNVGKHWTCVTHFIKVSPLLFKVSLDFTLVWTNGVYFLELYSFPRKFSRGMKVGVHTLVPAAKLKATSLIRRASRIGWGFFLRKKNCVYIFYI